MPVTDLPPETLNCPNCETPYQPKANYCNNCGQELHSHRVPFKHFVLEFLEGTIHFDHKVLGTLKYLVVNPGLIIRNFNLNKRARYVPPIRLYVFISFIYFFLVATGLNNTVESISESIHKVTDSITKPLTVNGLGQTVVPLQVFSELSAVPHIKVADTRRILDKHHIRTSTINDKILTKIIALNRGEVSAEQVGHQFLSTVTKMFFLLMPVFAFLIWLVCGRKKLYYSEALIFSLYFHCFFFLLLTLGWIAGKVFNAGFTSYLFPIACIYLFISVKTAFNNSYRRALFQSFLLIITYTIVFGIAFLLAILNSAIM